MLCWCYEYGLTKDHKSVSIRRPAMRSVLEMQKSKFKLFIVFGDLVRQKHHSILQNYSCKHTNDLHVGKHCHGLCFFWLVLSHALPDAEQSWHLALWHLHGCNTHCSRSAKQFLGLNLWCVDRSVVYTSCCVGEQEGVRMRDSKKRIENLSKTLLNRPCRVTRVTSCPCSFFLSWRWREGEGGEVYVWSAAACTAAVMSPQYRTFVGIWQ